MTSPATPDYAGMFYSAFLSGVGQWMHVLFVETGWGYAAVGLLLLSALVSGRRVRRR